MKYYVIGLRTDEKGIADIGFPKTFKELLMIKYKALKQGFDFIQVIEL